MAEEAPAAAPAKAAKKKSAPKPKKSGPSVSALIVQAVSASKERGGVSLPALKKALTAAGYDGEKNKARVRLALRKLLEKGTLVQKKGSYKMNKPAAEPKTAKKPAAKKAAPKAKKPAAAKKAKAAKKVTTPKKAKKSPKKAAKPAAKKVTKSPKKAAKSPKKPSKNAPAAKKAPAVKKAPAAKKATPKKTAKPKAKKAAAKKK